MSISNENKDLAKYITDLVGTNRTVQRFWDEEKKLSSDIFTCDDPQNKQVKFYGTIGLSDYPNVIARTDGGSMNIPVELLMVGSKEFDLVRNLLATCSFYIMTDKWQCQPGTVFMKMIETYYPDSEMKHVYFTSPFLWEDKLKAVVYQTKTVHWIQAIPISESELNYKKEKGGMAFEKLLKESEFDCFDFNRKNLI